MIKNFLKVRFKSIFKSVIFLVRSHSLQIFFALASIWIVSFNWGDIIFQSNIQSLYSPNKVFEELSTWSRANLGSINANSLWRYTSTESLFTILRFIGLGPSNAVQIVLGIFFYLAIRYAHKLFKWVYVSGSNSDLVYLLPAFYFTFNLYTLNLISGDYTLAIPHLLLPLQLYTALKGVETQSKKLAFIFLMLSVFVFGVNLVFNVILFFLIIVLYLYRFGVRHKKVWNHAMYFVFISITSVLINLWWLIPMFYTNLTNAKNSTAVLASETFYNNDTKVVHVLRNLGNWSFFASHRGTPYREYASLFKKALLLPSFFVPMTVWTYIVFFVIRTKQDYRKYLILAVTLIATYTFIGGSYPSWATSGFFKWFFSEVPFSQIFRNTYKWTSAVILITAVMLTHFSNILKIKLRRKQYVSFVFISTFLVAISVLPMFSGMSFDKKSVVSRIPSYWFEMAAKIDSDVDIVNSRVLLLPSQYFTVFKWENEFKSLPGNIANSLVKVPSVYNTCVGCGIDVSLEWINFLYKNIGLGKIDKLLPISGITHILQRNDFFLGYYNSQPPDTIKKILSKYSDINKVSTIGQLDLYSINTTSSLIYSPKKIIAVKQMPEVADIFNFLDFNNKDSFLILDQNKKFTSINKASTYLSKILENGNIYYSNDNGAVYGSFEVPYESDYKVIKRSTSTTDSGQNRFIIRNELFNDVGVFSASTTVKLKPGKYFVEDKLIKSDLVYQELFESDISSWLSVKDCAKNKPNAKLSAKFGNDLVRKSYLEVSSDINMACVNSSRFEVKPGSYYMLSFDTKNVSGTEYGFCLWDGLRCISREILQSPINGWFTYRHIFKTDAQTKNLSIYLYSPSQNVPTRVQYDDLSIFELKNIFGDYAIESVPLGLTEAAVVSDIVKHGNAKYSLKASTKTDFIIVFRESYHPKWMLHLKDGSDTKWQLPKFGTSKVHFFPIHQVINGFGNAWYVDTDELCVKQANCTQNPDGSYNLEMTIEFWPQRWFYLGLLISGTTFAGCIGYLVFDCIRMLRRKRKAKQTTV